jgi:hypothetical protein
VEAPVALWNRVRAEGVPGAERRVARTQVRWLPVPVASMLVVVLAGTVWWGARSQVQPMHLRGQAEHAAKPPACSLCHTL